VDGGENRNGLLGNVDAREDSGGLRDTWETIVENFRGKMAELKVDVVLLGSNTTAFADFQGH
jgi:hypothetical protein